MKVGIVGASGFTGKTLFSILENHEAEISLMVSDSLKGKKVSEVWPEFIESKAVFSELDISKINKLDLVFLCTPNDFSEKVAPKIKTKIVDLSQVHRFKDNWVYGLPEANKEKIICADKVANPGCFATACILSALPLQNHDYSYIVFDSYSGISGAGKKPTEKNSFNYLSENLFAYKLCNHEHNKEVKQFFGKNSFFSPHVAPLKQGIMNTTHIILEEDLSEEKTKNIFAEFYKKSLFVKPTKSIPDIMQVKNTNNCLVGGFEKDENQLVIVSVIDNLMKGASGQAVQNMNLMLGYKETEGLK